MLEQAQLFFFLKFVRFILKLALNSKNQLFIFKSRPSFL